MVGTHARGRRWIGLVVLATMLAMIPAVSSADSILMSENPRNWTPNVLNGQVETIAQVDDRIYIGGTFTQVANATSNGGTTYNRTRIAAFDATTGVVDTGFNVTLDGTIVRAILPANDGSGIFIAGDFNTVNGDTERKVAKLNPATGARVAGFDAAHIESEVRDLRQINNQLIVAGFFDEVGFQTRPGLASINGTSGAVSSFMNVALSGTHNGGATGAIKMEVTPDGDQLLIIGNFTAADGSARNQIAMLDTSGATASVANWATTFFTSSCSGSFNTYMRDLDISEDGTYAVISTTGAWAGGINAGVSCDTISRFEIDVTGTGLQPSWVNYTGGDTTYAVEISQGVAYIGGHMRWVNNPYAGDSEGPGAIDREGIAALDVRNGMPYSWDPGRERGVGVFDFMVNGSGLWGGSDTDRWSGELRQRLALFPDPPAAGAIVVADDVVETIPGYVFHLGEVSAGGNDDDVRRRFLEPGGTAGNTTSFNGSEDWFAARGAVRVNDTVYTGWSNETLLKRTFDGTSWGAPTALDLNNSNFIDDLDSITGMFFDPSDGRLYYTLSGSSNLFYRYFTPESDAVGAAPYTADGTVGQLDPNRVRGMFLSGGFIYFADSSSGDLRRIAFANGTVSGNDSLVTTSGDWRTRGLFVGPNVAPTAAFSVDCTFRECEFDAGSSFDPDGNIESFSWNFGDGTNGSGENVTHTYDDVDTFTVTLTVTDNDGATDNDSENATTTNAPPNASFTVDCDFRECSFDAGASSDSDGTIVSYSWSFGDGSNGSGETTSHTYDDVDTYTVTLTVTDNDGGNDGTTRQATATNEPPTASFTVTCEYRNCDVDAGGSSDPDGTIVSYSWNFGDGSNGSGETTSHTYDEAGDYTITLTVTDNDGDTDNDAASVEATNEPPPIHVHNLGADPKQLEGDKWRALVRITIYDANEEPVEGAVVTGVFGSSSVRSCTTGANGKCQVKMRVKDTKSDRPFTVTDVAPPPGYAEYDPDANHDAFGDDSDGTTIIVYQPIEVHSHDLDATAIELDGPKWRAKVKIDVRDSAGMSVEGAEVTGVFGQN
nr:PKD domain-containing protein [Acidimicrobiia bacterium]